MACLQHPIRCYGRAVCVVPSQEKRSFDKIRLSSTATQHVVSRPLADQSSSPLFQLPRELRDEIWAYALAPLDNTRSAHFHIYDEVIDSCTYKADSMVGHSGALRKEGRRCALLRTCHAIYNESIGQLYDDVHFELVLFGGYVRPDFIYYWNDETPPARKHVHSRSRNRLGKLSECTLFKRLRQATIVVQPGALPKVSAYAERVASLLNALDYGRSMRTLGIRFNFAHGTNVPRYVTPIIASFLPLARLGSDRRLRLRLEVYISNMLQPGFGQYRAAVRTLQEALSIPKGELVLLGHNDDGCCMRGAYGKSGYAPDYAGLNSRYERHFILPLALVTSPLWGPVMLPYEYVKRKRVKGEEWRVFARR